jgi:hypothetical protein
MENKGLLFIPDISGFTRFVNEIEIDHSRHIIQQLLEVLINSNDIGLEISEIEGDAILFYRFGEPLKLESLYHQVEKMFKAFHQHLRAYDHRKICQCKACVSAVSLTLKVITHYGEFTSYNVKQFQKLIGRDVIVAHQLLKNDIREHEYWLVTENLVNNGKTLSEFADWMQWNDSSQQTESGQIVFNYTYLTPLKEEIKPEVPYGLEIANKTKVASATKVYNVDVKTLVYTVVHFEFRPDWFDDLASITEVEHFLPGIGTRHKHTMKDGSEVMMYTSSFMYDPDTKTSFSETDEKKKSSTYFIIEKLSETTSSLTLELYYPSNVLKLALFNLLHKKEKEEELKQSLERLEKIVMEMVVPLEF